MIENLKLREKNRMKKLERIAETRMAVYIYIYIVYCHLENKKANLEVAGHKFEYNFVKFNNKIRDRTILNLKYILGKVVEIFQKGNLLKEKIPNIYFNSIGLSFCYFPKGKRAGPFMIMF